MAGMAKAGRLFGVMRHPYGILAGSILLSLLVVAVVVLKGWSVSSQAPVVHLDNFSGQVVRIDLDGSTRHTVAANSSKETTLPAGTHTLTIHTADGGKQLDRLEVTVAKGKVYVLNVLGAQVYESREGVYSVYSVGDNGPAPRAPRIIQDKWFEVVEHYVFKPLPDTVKLPKGSEPKAYTALVRVSRDELTQRAAARQLREIEDDLKAIGEAYERSRGPTLVGRPGPTPPRGMDDLILGRNLSDKSRYEIVWGYAGAFGKAEPGRRLAWERDAPAGRKRLVLLGDFRTVQAMSPEELARVPVVTRQPLSDARPVPKSEPAPRPRLPFGVAARPPVSPLSRPTMTAPSAAELQAIIRSNEAIRAAARGHVDHPLRGGR